MTAVYQLCARFATSPFDSDNMLISGCGAARSDPNPSQNLKYERDRYQKLLAMKEGENMYKWNAKDYHKSSSAKQKCEL